MSKAVYKYDKKIRRWYREVDGKRQENLKLGVGYNTTNGLYLFNSDGTKTKLNPSSSKSKNNYINWSLYDFTNTNPSSSLSTLPIIERAANLDLLKKGPKIPYKPGREVQLEYARRKLEVRRYNLLLEKKRKEAQRINDPREVREWGLLVRYKNQLNDEANAWNDLLNEQYSRKRDAQSIDRGYKIKLVDGVNQMGKPAKYYYFYNPKTGELGNKVSKYYLKDNGYNMKGVTPVVFENIHDAQMVSLHKNTTNLDLIKIATNNIDHFSADLANIATGGVFSLTPTNVYGGIVGGARKGQSFYGAVSNTLFGYDPVDPEKSGNKGILETYNSWADWADEHPYATMAINAAGDLVAGKVIHGLGTRSMAGTSTGNALAGRTNQLLGQVGYTTNRIGQTVAKFGNQGLQATKQAVKNIPGGSTAGRKVLNTGRRAAGNIKGYGNQVYQLIPYGFRLGAKRAYTSTKNLFGKIKPVYVVDRGLSRLTGIPLTPDARTGLKVLTTGIPLVYNTVDYFRGNNDDLPAYTKMLKFVPGVKRYYNWYSKAKAGADTYDNVMDMYDYGVTPEGIGNTAQSAIYIFG